MTLKVERETLGATWRWWKVTCHPTGEGLDGVTWAWRVRRDDSHDPPQWDARTPSGVGHNTLALARWQRAVIDAVVSWERGEAGEGRA